MYVNVIIQMENYFLRRHTALINTHICLNYIALYLCSGEERAL